MMLELRRMGLGALIVAAGATGGNAWGAGPAEAAAAVELQGDALVRAPGTDTFASSSDGTHPDIGSGVRAPSRGEVVIKAAEGVSLRLAPDTTVTLRPATWLPAERPGANPLRAFQVGFANGEIDVEVHEKSNALGVLLMLPNGRSLALWRGSANVSIHGDNVSIAFYEGMGITGSASKWKPLQPGQGYVLDSKADATSRTTPITPTWADLASSGANPFALVRGDAKANLSASWTPVANADHYRVELTADPRFLGPITFSDVSTTTLRTDALAAGSYVARVRAVSTDGLASPPSKPLPLRVARMVIPDLAMTTNAGAVVLPLRSAILLDDPRDLEVATISEFNPTAAPRWVPASNEISLEGSARRNMRIRHVPSLSETTLMLVRREMRARVSFGPVAAHWPENPVDITVKVEDLSGYLDPSREPLNFDVHVDMDPAALTWSHTGDTWTAHVPPKSGPGPWVIRVNVMDRAGVPIGASLVDVDGPVVQRAAYHGNDAKEIGLMR
ncbi:MAG TPA: hypothetical protein VGI39_16090 [Polyangiaceae bacterium]|jgi:hypothetical protein